VPTEFQPKPILHALIAHDVDFVMIGEWQATEYRVPSHEMKRE
jgi:hypothetical protein